MNNQKNPRKYIIKSSQSNLNTQVDLNSLCWWLSGVEIKDSDQTLTVDIYDEGKNISKISFITI